MRQGTYYDNKLIKNESEIFDIVIAKYLPVFQTGNDYNEHFIQCLIKYQFNKMR